MKSIPVIEGRLNIFANYQINDEERFTRLKDSFLSIKEIGACKWIINVRGNYKNDVVAFLSEHLGSRLSAHTLESGRGWFNDSRKMLPEITADYVLFWIEDHINLADVSCYGGILSDMKEHDIDVLTYSWFDSYAHHRFKAIEKEQTQDIEFFMWDKATNDLIQRTGKSYIVGVCGIFKTSFFKTIVQSNHPAVRRWDPRTPFDFEKSPKDVRWLPFKQAVPKFELFGVIDDDNSGPSLQSRGLYPARVSRQLMIEASRGKGTGLMQTLPAGLVKILLPISIGIKRLGYTLRYYFASD
jgi:hypothetical protein